MILKDQIRDEKLQYDINREASKISALSSGKIDQYEYLTGEEILSSNQQQIIEQPKFTYSHLGEPFEKQTKTTDDQGKNQISAIKESGKQIIESNELVKNDFNIDRSDVVHEKQKEIFNDLVKERALEFSDIKDKIDSNNLVYTFKTVGKEPKDFRKFKTPLKLFEDLRDGNINPKEASKNETNFKSDLNEIKIGDNKSPNQKYTIENISNFFDLREKIIDFFRDYSFLLSEANTKQNKGQDLKY